MKRLFLFSLAASILSALPARAEDRPPADPAKLLGTWKIVSGEKEGMKVPEEHLKGTLVRITANTIVVLDGANKQTYAAEYKLDTTKKVWPITMTAAEGTPKGEMVHGIVLLEGDALRLCYALPGAPLPEEFATRKGARQLLFVMERAKP